MDESSTSNHSRPQKELPKPERDDSTRIRVSGRLSATVTVAVVGLVMLATIVPRGAAGFFMMLFAILLLMSAFGARFPWKDLIASVRREFEKPAPSRRPVDARATDWEPDAATLDEMQRTRPGGPPDLDEDLAPEEGRIG
ncbi:MAG TPA: hypothetical protein VG820_06400 [Fimbriimonadaceae bacterium]|nr:hypothetical protein [Fimbriimonadaceae bacterium]